MHITDRNNGDVTGEQDRLARPTAVDICAPAPERLTTAERTFLLDLARKSLSSVTANGSLPEVDAQDIPPKLAAKKACFVTLTKNGALRGCMGHLMAIEPQCAVLGQRDETGFLRC